MRGGALKARCNDNPTLVALNAVMSVLAPPEGDQGSYWKVGSTPMSEERKITQTVRYQVQDGRLVHCYLACGHLVTVHQEELKESPSPSTECWACEGEKRKKSPSNLL